jgi:hypothetical protein
LGNREIVIGGVMNRIFILLLLVLVGCGFQEQDKSDVNFSFSVDVNKLQSLASSSSGLSSSHSALSSNKAASVAATDQLMFFGVVVRTVSGITTDAGGLPAGAIVPGASRLFNVWQNPTEFEQLMTTGKVAISTYVPAPSDLSVTFYGVFISDDDNDEGPGTFTTIYHVGGPYHVDGAGATIKVAPDTQILEDDHAPFSKWAGIFANASGAPIANTDITLEHCKIGFRFEQSMFDAEFNKEDKYAFHTDSKGMINSHMIAGVDWKIIAGDGTVIKPCGGTPFAGVNYPSGSPEISFLAYIGTDQFETPASFFGDARITASNFLSDTNISNSSVDHDGDGLPTDTELDLTTGNPFMADGVFRQKFRGNYASVSTVTYDPAATPSPTATMQIYRNTNQVTGSCSTGSSLQYYDDVNKVWTNVTATFSENYSCSVTFEVSSLGIPANTTKRIVFKIDPNYTADIDGDSVQESLYFIKAADFCNGTGCTAPTISNFELYLRSWGNGPEDVATVVTNYTTLNPYPSCSGSDSGFEYAASLSGTNFSAGGIIYLSTAADCSTSVINLGIMDADGTSIAAYLHSNGNGTSPNYNVCYKNAVNSTSYAKASQQIAFVYDPNSACQPELSSATFGSISDSYSSTPHMDISFNSGGVPVDPQSLKVNFTSGQYICITGLDSLSAGDGGYCSMSDDSTNVISSHNLSGAGSYYVDSIDFYSATACSGTGINVDYTGGSSSMNVTSVDISSISFISPDSAKITFDSVLANPDIYFTQQVGQAVDSIELGFSDGKAICLTSASMVSTSSSYYGGSMEPIATSDFFAPGIYNISDVSLYPSGSSGCAGSPFTTITGISGQSMSVGASSNYVFINSVDLSADLLSVGNAGPYSCGASTGLEAADCICTYIAQNSGFISTYFPSASTRPWKAILSDGRAGGAAVDRIYTTGTVINMNSEVIDSDYDIFGGTQTSFKPNYDESGTIAGANAWTGSNPDGTAHTNNCQNWEAATSGQLGSKGSANYFMSSPEWLTQAQMDCMSWSFRLYCISQ